mgnify:CR=1 FL=1
MNFLPSDEHFKDILKQSRVTWRPDFLEALMVEECCELGTELSRGIGRPSRKDKQKIQEELADVIIKAWELAAHYDDDGGVSRMIVEKLEREKARIEDPTYGITEKIVQK